MSILLGNKLKELRESKNVRQRELATLLEIDTATYCKFEKGDRRVRREQIEILSTFFDIQKQDLLSLWLADKISEIIEDDNEIAKKAFQVAKKHLNIY